MITIEPSLQSLITPLSTPELELLTAQVLEQGCLAPLCVWKTDDGRKVLLDGHNRYKICTENNRQFTTVNVKLNSLDHAKLWVLQHQAGRRNLTDDQRAIIWNDIREQRSKIASAEGAAKARAAKDSVDSPKSGETTRQSKRDTRAEVAREAKLPKSKLDRAAALKKYQPELHEKVRNGTLKMRDTSSLLKKSKSKKPIEIKHDFYRHLGHLLDGTFKGTIKDRLDTMILSHPHTPKEAKAWLEIADVLETVAKAADEYAHTLRRTCKANNFPKARVA